MTTEFKPSYQIQMTEVVLIFIGVFLLTAVYQFELDFIIADFIYGQFEWKFKKSFFIEGLLHKFARIMLIAIYLYLIYKLVQMISDTADPVAIYNLFILILAIGSSVAIVSIAKRFMDVDCPWDLIRYGGDKPFFPLFAYNNQYLPSAHCFPASHASIGFSWMALFFYFKVTGSQLKFKALGFVLCMGTVFGFAQQLRGAHFISHDLWSFLICLITCLLIYNFAYRKPPKKSLKTT
jgi:membrane-associated PAP2 superfamily phosphatase